MAYSPQTGYFYAAGVAGLTWLRRAEDPSFFSTFNGRVPGINSLDYGVLAAIDSRTNKIAWKKEYRMAGRAVPRPRRPVSSSWRPPIARWRRTTRRAGVLHVEVQSWGGWRSADRLELDGEQYVATLAGGYLWAFKLGGTVAAAAPATFSAEERFTGPIVDTANIETASLQRDRGFIGTRYFTDDHAFEPYRAASRPAPR